jgi:hypothetical protein
MVEQLLNGSSESALLMEISAKLSTNAQRRELHDARRTMRYFLGEPPLAIGA